MRSCRTGARGTTGGLTPSQCSMQEAEQNFLVEALKRAKLETKTLQEELHAATVVTIPPAKIIAAATTTNSDTAFIT